MFIRKRLTEFFEAGTDMLCRLLGCALVVAVVLNFINVVSRYVFNHPLIGFDEVEIYLMISIAFLGCLVAHLRRRHLRMDVLVKAFPQPLALSVAVLESLVAVAVFCTMAWISGSYALRLVHLGNVSENAEIPLWIPHSVLAIAFTLMLLVGTVRLLCADFTVMTPHGPARSNEETAS